MRKLITVLTLGIILTGNTAFASAETEIKTGNVTFEIGSTLNSKVKGTGAMSAEIDGKSGFKASLIADINNHLSFQYKYGSFKSEEDTTRSLPQPITTYAKAEIWDANLLYKLNPNLTLIAGYENTDISFGKAVLPASKAAVHLGIHASHEINDKTTLFSNLIGGKDVSLKELGINYKLSHNTSFSMSYAEREMKDLDLIIPIANFNKKESYNMSGITCVFSQKL